jgi:hypothetical protein
MSMLTSRPSALASVCLALIASACCALPALAGAADSPRQAGADDIRNAQSRIAALVKQSETLPEDPVASLKLPKLLYWSGAAGGRLLVPVTIRYKGLANAYCRVATLAGEQTEALFVDVPPQSNYDECRGFDSVRYLDINQDGILDIVASVSMKSNAFDGYVAEQAVFLSTPKQPSGYCYSDKASRNLRPKDMQSENNIQRALEKERQRLGIAGFQCEDRSSR